MVSKIIGLVVPKVQAAAPNITISNSLVPTDVTDIPSIVNLIINTVFILGLAASLLFVILGGIKYVTSQGDQTKAEEARNTITNAVIGAVIIVAFRVIIDIALQLIGGQPLSGFFG